MKTAVQMKKNFFLLQAVRTLLVANISSSASRQKNILVKIEEMI